MIQATTRNVVEDDEAQLEPPLTPTLPALPASVPARILERKQAIDQGEDITELTSNTIGGGGGGGANYNSLWDFLRWAADMVVVPCKPVNIFSLLMLLLLRPPPSPPIRSTSTGTLICTPDMDRKKAVSLFFQDGGPSVRPFVFLDLPIPLSELLNADDNGCRITLECKRSSINAAAAAVPLLDVRAWTVFCNGRRRVGFAARRVEATEDESRVLRLIGAVSAGAGFLPSSAGGSGGGTRYMRGSFDRVVGSEHSESFYLVEPIRSQKCSSGLSIFFLRY